MPWIIVAPDQQAEPRSAIHRERVSLADLESDHFSAQLIERLGWAVVDADEDKHSPERGEANPAHQHRNAPRRREPVRV